MFEISQAHIYEIIQKESRNYKGIITNIMITMVVVVVSKQFLARIDNNYPGRYENKTLFLDKKRNTTSNE